MNINFQFYRKGEIRLLKNIKDLLAEMKLRCRLDTAIAEELERQDKEISLLRQHREMDHQSLLTLTKEIANLRMIVRQQSGNSERQV